MRPTSVFLRVRTLRTDGKPEQPRERKPLVNYAPALLFSRRKASGCDRRSRGCFCEISDCKTSAPLARSRFRSARTRAVENGPTCSGRTGTGKSSVLRAIGLALAGSDAAAEVVARSRGLGPPRRASGQHRCGVRRWRGAASGPPGSASDVGGARLSSSRTTCATAARDRCRRHQGGAQLFRRRLWCRAPTSHRPYVDGPVHLAVPQSASARHGDAVQLRCAAGLARAVGDRPTLPAWRDRALRRGGRARHAVARRVLRKGIRSRAPTADVRNPAMEALPLSALSDGYQAMAAWSGDLLWQITETFADYSDPLRARGLLLIDEIRPASTSAVATTHRLVPRRRRSPTSRSW